MKKLLISLIAVGLAIVAQAAITDLAARAKSGKVQLTWSAQTENAEYAVFRRLVPATAFVLIATTDSEFSTYLDTAVINDNTYCYQVLFEGGLSNEACATPVRRRRR